MQLICKYDVEGTEDSGKHKFQHFKGLPDNNWLLGEYNSQWTSDMLSVDRSNIESVLEKILSTIEPVALKEQNFCISFFQLTGLKQSNLNTSESEIETKSSKIIDEELKQLMNNIFNNLESELLDFTMGLEKYNHL